jgi:hypothetical protein
MAAGFLALVTLLAIGSKMETVATASIAGMMTSFIGLYLVANHKTFKK